MIERGLIIDEPWISKILEGSKTWEMRSRPTKLRGLIGLIRKGSGQVVGVADLMGNGPCLDQESFSQHADKHGVTDPQMHVAAVRGGWIHPWVLSAARPLPRPVPYTHKQGAVIFVKLDDAVVADVTMQLA